MEVEVTQINGKIYAEIVKEEINGIMYVYLANVEDDYDFCIRKIVSDGEKQYYEGLTSEEEFNNVLVTLSKKVKIDLE